MSKFYKIFLFIALIQGISCSKNKEHTHKKSSNKSYYTCSMHPNIRQDRPGKCPICHMNLTKIVVDLDDKVKKDISNTPKWRCEKYPDVTSVEKSVCPMDGTPMVLNTLNAKKVVAKVKLRKAQLGHFSPAFFPVTKMKMTKKIRLLGSVAQSEEKESSIPARIGGRVDKVFVKSTGSFVKKGDPVLKLYSPKLISAGEEYLLARKTIKKNSTKEFKEMLLQSEERLSLWGIKKLQYQKWFMENKIPKNIVIYSESTGIVRKRNATVGKYFKEGQNFFELSDLTDVWIEMDVYEHDSSLVKIGQKVELEFNALPGEIITGKIDFINPVLDEKSRTLKIRTTIKNASGKLRPGMIANASLNIQLEGKPYVVPRSAIIDTGKRKVVWLKEGNNQFKAKVIFSGYESDGYVEIKKGLQEGDQVVIEGNFLLDAQAQLFGGYEDMKKSDPHKDHL